ncbi:MAG: hypothetical protein SGI89_09010 [bacterium]|nr:hypothetical protein [bacterium]
MTLDQSQKNKSNMRIMIGCKEATLLMVMDEESKLSFSARCRLIVHLTLCKFCKLFEKQNRFISNNIKNISTEKHFSLTEKENLIRQLQSSMNK